MKRTVQAVFIFTIIISQLWLFFAPIASSAQITTSGNPIIDGQAQVDASAVKVYSPSELDQLRSIQAQREGIAVGEKAERTLAERLKSAAAVAYKTSLHYLLNTFAYDTANWLASGGEGQTPMFHTDNWGDYVKGVVDGAAGVFVEKVTKEWWGEDFNVCDADPRIKVNISFALAGLHTKRPKPPSCTISELARDWQSFIRDPNFLDRVTVKFSPEGNDIVAAFLVFDQYQEFINTEKSNAENQRREDEGSKGILTKITDKILTPSFLVREEARQLIQEGHFEAEEIHTGDIVADAVSTFVQTLAGKLTQRLFKEGLALLNGSSDGGSSRSGNKDLYNPSQTGSLFAGSKAAESRFITLLDAGIITSGPYEVLQRLATCTNVNNPKPDECVIDHQLRLAIEKELTVREAIEAGYLDGNAPFGFTPQGFQPRYTEGYPHRSLLIMRAHRIIPVTWELAAEIINSGQSGENKIWTLNDLIAQYNDASSPFYKLIDENWVLKAPEAYCKAEGYGEVIQNQNVLNGQLTVSRASYCVDYQSCIEKDADGQCIYGYCTQERRSWNLDAQTCNDYYNTCQTFTGSNGVVSYLQNTLEYNSCSADNAGCQWYCQEYNVVDGVWTCVSQGERVLKACNQIGGCGLSTSCTIAAGASTCTDATSGAQLAISGTCSSGSQFWNGATSQCDVTASCTVKQGGVSCTQTGCENLPNAVLNPSFETVAAPTPPGGNRYIAQHWYTTDPGFNYFQRVSGSLEQADTGQYSVRFYSSGALQNGEWLRSDPINLTAGTYTFSGYVYNKLNSGTIRILVGSSSSVFAGGANSVFKDVSNTSADKNHWVEVSQDFTLTGDATIEFVVHVMPPTGGGNVSGAAWFDTMRISQSCLVTPVTLKLAGTVDEDESKIHFDRDVQECDSSQDGCSEFLTTSARLLNLFGNGEFTAFAGTVNDNTADSFEHATGQFGGNNAANGISTYAILDQERSDSVLKLQNSNQQSDPYVSVNLLANQANLNNRTFLVTYLAKAGPGFGIASCDRENTNPNPQAGCFGSDVNGYSVFVRTLNPGGNGVDLEKVKMAGLTDTTWKRFSAVFTVTGVDAAQTGLQLVLRPPFIQSGYVLYDDLQLIELTSQNYTIDPNASHPLVSGSVHLRKAPDYLGCQGFTTERPSDYVLAGVGQVQCEAGSNTVWRPDSCDGSGNCCHDIDPAECFNYAPFCQLDEVGCELYAPIAGGPGVPGVITTTDLCPAECVGYDAYKQSTTYFETNEALEYFIPSTARQCSASQAGCDQFTNLDEVAAGGEGVDYFRYLRQCVKPTDSGSSCSNFYSWQGSDETGFQLRSHSLNATGNAPTLVSPDDADWLPEWGKRTDCDGPEDLASNPFCQEIFGQNGQIYYEILQNTVSCSDDCHPFRRSSVGDDPAQAEANCDATNPAYDNTKTPNPGWQDGACIYQAIPSEGVTCSAAAAGCREYRGNRAGNVYSPINDTFEDGDYVGWVAGDITSEALSVGGHSLRSSGGKIATYIDGLDNGVCDADRTPTCDSATTSNCFNPALGQCVAKNNGQTCLVDEGQTECGLIDDQLMTGKTYLLSFWMKSGNTNALTVTATMANGTVSANGAPTPVIGSATAPTDWNYFKFGPFTLEEVKENTQLVFSVAGGGEVYLDNIRLTEVTDYSYVIKNSWQTPASCDTNPYVTPAEAAPQFMLGCQAYRDTGGQTQNLRSFTRLCRESAIGCDAVIDTHNSNSPLAQTFNTGDASGQVSVKADNITYIVNRPEFACQTQAQGCQLLGAPQLDQNKEVVGYGNTYLINDPDQYASTLCGSGEVGCQEFQTEDGFAYFKDPGRRTCEYRKSPGTGAFGWFITGSNAASPDCPLTETPLGIARPDGWAGVCTASASGCTEYIEPVSDIATNEVFNGSLTASTGGINGWSGSGPYTQTLNLRRDRLYTLALSSINSAAVTATVTCDNISSFDNSMSITGATAKLIGAGNVSGRFLVRDDISCALSLDFGSSTVPSGFTVAVRETYVGYNIDNFVDKTSCNGVVDPARGCVLFNDRSAVNYSIGDDDNSYLTFDADATRAGQTPNTNCANGVCDSNEILKVKPDRMCGEWLDCRTKVKGVDAKGKTHDYCLELAACDQMNTNGECINFVSAQRQNIAGPGTQNFTASLNAADRLSTVSGYAKAGLTFAAGQINGYYPYSLMTQEGGVAELTNGGFEYFTAERRPFGWLYPDGVWVPTMYRVVDNPNDATQLEGVTIKSGRAILRLSAGVINGKVNRTVSDPIDVFGGETYTLSVAANTLNLRPTTATAIVEVYDTATNLLVPGARLVIPAGEEWRTSLLRFTPDSATRSVAIVLTLASPGELDGAVYFDDISIKPVLLVQSPADSGYTFDINGSILNSNRYVGQTCRLYPQASSLSCSYLDSEFTLHKGWQGYCLQYDSKNPAICLQWWPIDLVEGDSLEFTPGYANRVPLYYCLQMKESDLVSGDPANARPGSGEDQYFPQYSIDDSILVRENLRVTTNDGSEPVTVQANEIESLLVPTQVCFLPAPGEDQFTDLAPQGGRFEWWNHSDLEYYDMSAAGCSKIGTQSLCEGNTYCDWKPDPDPNKPGSCISACDKLDNATCGAAPSCLWKTVKGVGQCTTRAQGEYLDNGFCLSSFSPQVSSDPSHNAFSVKLNFDANGRFSSYTITVTDDDDNTSDFLFDRIVFRTAYCTDIVKTVTSLGQNRAWQARVKEGSDYVVPILNYEYDNGVTKDNYPPFGGAVPPEPIDDPSSWSGLSGTATGMPLFYMPPFKSGFDRPYQARAGTPYAWSNYNGSSLFARLYQDLAAKLKGTDTLADAVYSLSRLFAKPFGFWQWDAVQRRYVTPTTLPSEINNWNVPTTTCPAGGRVGNADYCAIAPVISSIVVNPTTVYTTRGFSQVNLKFNAIVDQEQQPLGTYQVDWGDGTVVSVSGVSIRDKVNANDPFELAHSYNYYDMLAKNKVNDFIYCTAAGEAAPGYSGTQPANTCAVRARVKVIDNWGWCNGVVNAAAGNLTPQGYYGNFCQRADSWTAMNGYITIGVNP